MPAYTGVYVFGDSLVDSGNALKAAETADAIPFVSLPDGAPTASKGYFQGRFSDGYNFTDLIANKMLGVAEKTTFPYGFEIPGLGLDIPFASKPKGPNLNFAYGGAQANQVSEIVPDLDDQTDAFKNSQTADPNALVIVTIGGNDVRDLVKLDSQVTGAAAQTKLVAAANEIAQEVGQLFAFGVRHVLVTGIPDVGLIPYYTGAANEPGLRALATQYSKTLESLTQTALSHLALPVGSDLFRFSLMNFDDRLFANPAAYDLTNLTQARTVVQQGALAAVGTGFLFFDQVHPSAQVHALAAAAMLGSLPGGQPDAPVATQLGAKWAQAIDLPGTSDTFGASLVAGHSYVFDLMGISSGAGTLSDPKLQIVNSSGAVVAQDDDSGLGLDAHLTFTPTQSGDYTLLVSGVGVAAGSYILQGANLRGSDVAVQGGPGNDVIRAVSGTNYLRGNDGNDSIVGGTGFDDINGNAGNDTSVSGGGDDWVVGGQGNDNLRGGDGANLVYGNLGNDTCDGGAGADILRGGQGNDSLAGGTGNDFLSGDMGSDTMTGGAGADIFHTFGDAGIDRVLDFHRSEGDRVQLDPGTQYSVAQVGADTVISMTGGAQMILVGVSMSSLSAGWIFTA